MNSIRKAPLTVIAGPMGASKSSRLILMLIVRCLKNALARS
jgi:thymidine kinase